MDSQVQLSHVVNSYLRVKVGRSIIACSRYRERDNKNQYVVVFEQGKKRPGFVTNIYNVAVEVDQITHSIPFLEVQMFKKHPYKDFYGVNCPLKIWDTCIEAEFYVPAVAIFGKCIVVKAELQMS